MKISNPTIAAAAHVNLAQFALYALYEQYAKKGEFSMGSYDSIVKHLDDAFAALNSTVNKRTYPNPCGEILLGGAEIFRRSTRPDND